MVLAWLDAEKAKECGAKLGQYFIQNVSVDDKADDKKFASKTLKVLNTMTKQLADFKKDNKLNIYKRAQLSNTFKWTLKNAGFNDHYINELTIWLVKNM
jgi:hypothetical protein